MPKIAIVGVKTGQGRELLNLLSETGINSDDIIALETRAPLGTLASYGEDDEIDVQNLDTFDFKKADIAVFTASKEISSRFIKNAIKANISVLDLSGALATSSDIPMVMPEITPFTNIKTQTVISAPSSETYQVLLPLAETLKKHKLKRLVINFFVSVSHYGHEAMDELFSQSRKIFLNESLADSEQIFKKQIAFNVLPQVGEFIGDETALEWLLNVEIKKILQTPIKVHANAAFVPTFIGDAAFVNAEFEDEVDANEIRNDMKQIKNVVVFDKTVDTGYVSVDDIQGEDNIYVSRVRQDVSVENGISYWTVADNLRAGVAKPAQALIAQMLNKDNKQYN